MRIYCKIIQSGRPGKEDFNESHVGSGPTLQAAVTAAVDSWNEEKDLDDPGGIQLDNQITFEQLVSMYTDFNSEDSHYVRSVRVWMDTEAIPED